MKRKVFIIWFFGLMLLAQSSFGQKYFNIIEAPKDLPLKDGFITYQGVIEIPNASMAQLYGFAKKFIAETYTNTEVAIDMDDTLNGVIVVKAKSAILVEWFEKNSGRVERAQKVAFTKYVLIFETKDGRLRYTIKDFVLQTTSDAIAFSLPEINNPVEGYIRKRNEYDPAKEYKNNELAGYNFSGAYLDAFGKHLSAFTQRIEPYFKNQKSEDW